MSVVLTPHWTLRVEAQRLAWEYDCEMAIVGKVVTLGEEPRPAYKIIRRTQYPHGDWIPLAHFAPSDP